MRGGQLSVPHGKDQIQLGDEVYVIAPTEQLPRTLQIFGHEESQARRIVIAGGGNVGLYLARMIEDKQPNVRVKIVEASRMPRRFRTMIQRMTSAAAPSRCS